MLFAKIGISRRPRFSWGYSNAQTVQAVCLAFSRRPRETGTSPAKLSKIAILTVSSFFSLAEAVK